jgi:putative sterol carrier protein
MSIDPQGADMSSDLEQIDASAIDPGEFARNIGRMSEDQLREAMDGPLRETIITEIFGRMEHHFRAGAAQDAVIHWTISGAPGEGEDAWEVVIAGTTCTASPEHRSEPRVSLKLDGVDFLRLVTGNAIGPTLFMSGKLKIEGDVMFAAQIQSMFTIPG